MECVVCFEKFSSNRVSFCKDKLCRGREVICDECYPKIAKCIYCKEPLFTEKMESERLYSRMFMTVYYAMLVSSMFLEDSSSSVSYEASES